jgi:uncharacterized protein involved in exopolysaccharide biosynthesis
MANNPFDLSPREFLAVIFKRKWQCLLIPAAFLVIPTLYSYTIQPYYVATAKLLVENGREFQVRSSPGQTIVSAPYSTKRQVINSEVQILTSPEVASAVVKRIGIKRLFPTLREPASKGASMAAIQHFQAGFSARPVEESNVIDLAYSSPDRQLAATVLAAAIGAYLQRRATIYNSDSESFLRTQEADYKRRLDAVTQRLADLKKSHALFDVDAQRAQLTEERTALAGLVQQLRAQSRQAQQQSASLHDPGVANAAKAGPNKPNGILDAIEKRAEALREGEIRRRSEQVAQIDQQLNTLEDGSRDLQELERQKTALIQLVDTYRTRYEDAHIDDQLTKQNIASVRLVQPAYVPERPAGPRHMLFALGGLVAGALAAAGLLIYLLVFREALINVESVERLVGLRVLASVRQR